MKNRIKQFVGCVISFKTRYLYTQPYLKTSLWDVSRCNNLIHNQCNRHGESKRVKRDNYVATAGMARPHGMPNQPKEHFDPEAKLEGLMWYISQFRDQSDPRSKVEGPITYLAILP